MPIKTDHKETFKEEGITRIYRHTDMGIHCGASAIHKCSHLSSWNLYIPQASGRSWSNEKDKHILGWRQTLRRRSRFEAIDKQIWSPLQQGNTCSSWGIGSISQQSFVFGCDRLSHKPTQRCFYAISWWKHGKSPTGLFPSFRYFILIFASLQT